MQVLVMDSHRPFHLYNVYGDGEDANGEFVDVGDIEKARVLLIHDPDMDDDIPDKETMMDANLDEEDQEEEEEEDLDESPVQRRRVGEDGESVAVAGGEEDDREERRKQREIREQARSTVAEYYNATSRGPATAMVLMEVSSKVRRVNQLDSATLWWAILGVTEQYINDDLDEHLYDKWLQTLTDEAIALNSRSSRELGRSEIVQYDEFRFYLLEHWNLYDSMYVRKMLLESRVYLRCAHPWYSHWQCGGCVCVWRCVMPAYYTAGTRTCLWRLLCVKCFCSSHMGPCCLV
jgi:cell division control protein 45